METAAFLNDSGIALTEANRPYEAIPLFRKALDMEPENPLLWLNLGIAQQRTGDYEQAIDSFHSAIAISNDMADAWFSMGLIYYEMEEFELSEECYHSALNCGDDDPRIWNNLGVLYFAQGIFGKARDCFERSVSLSPHFYDALFNLRDVCRELGDYRAAAEFGRALSGLSDRRGNSNRTTLLQDRRSGSGME